MRIVLRKKKKSKTESKPLAQLGFANYGSYLDSSLWQVIRSMVLYRDRYRCRGCGKKASEVHHLDYDKEVLAGKAIHYLFSLCKRCHNKIHFSTSGQRRSHELSRINTFCVVFDLNKKQTAAQQSELLVAERNRNWFEQNQLNILLSAL